MKLLLLLSATFPYDSGEEFLENEIAYANGFDRVFLCPCGLKQNSVQTRGLPPKVECIRIQRAEEGHAAYGSLFLRLACVRKELFELIRTGRATAGRIHEMLFFMKKAVRIFHALQKEKVLMSADDITVYSYWFYDAAAAGALFTEYLKANGKKAKLVSRAHGFDVHEDRNERNYLPMRRYLMESVSALFPCAREGTEIFRNRFPEFAEKVTTAHLGTRDRGYRGGDRSEFHLVSCSYMVPVKRLHLIIEALKKADFPVVWTHIGSGPLENDLKRLAKDLPSCVSAEFRGAMKNDDVLKFYKSRPMTAFLNVSSSEGIPVSIMEACSFGFPVIATDVGGTGEIVKNKENGFLLRADFSPEELLDKLRRLASMKEAEYQRFCEKSRSIWLKSFSAEKNYSEFYEVLVR